MAAKQEMNKNSANNMNCSLCTKFIKILKHKPEGDTELKCDECGDDNDPVVALCVESDCELYLCQDCYKSHSKKHKTHDIVLLSPASKDGFTVQPARKILYCPEHQKNELDYYCKTCDKIVCLYCTVKDHVGHTHDIVEKTASEHRNMLMKIIAPVEEMTDNLSKAEANIVSTQEKIKEQASEIDQQIDKCYVEQLKELNEHHKQLKKQLRDAVSQKEDALKEQLKDVTSLQDQLKGIKKVQEGLEKTTDRKVLSTKKQDMEIHMQKVSERYKNLNTEPVEYDNFKFVPAKSYSFLLGHLFTFANPYTSEVIDLPSIAYCGHKVEFKIIAKDSKGKNCTKGGSLVCVQLKSFTGDVTAGEVRDNNDGSYMASFVAEQVGEAKLSVAINGEQIKGSPYSIVVGRNYQAIDKPSKIVNNNGSMGKPWGISFGRNGLWAVADYSNDCVYIFDDKDQLVRKVGSNGSNNGQFSNPRGVAFDSHNHLYVADNGNHRVQKFNTNGNYLLQFGSNGSSAGQLNSPRGIAIHKDKAYIADNSNKRVSVFHTNGQFYNTFGSDVLGYQRDVAVSADKYLVVAGYYPDCICTFTLDGHYIGKFGTKGSGMCEFNDPHGITGDLNGFIIVADTDNHRVSIFDEHGGCIHSFGSYGSANGQFSGPRGIALSPNGSIYVSDYGNKRIQIFSDF